MITIPAKDTKKFSQPNYGDTQGNLWGTYGVDLTKNTGRVRLTRTETVYSEADDNDFGLPVAFAYFDALVAGEPVFIAYADRIFIGGSDPISTFTQDTKTNSPNDTSSRGDMVVFNGKLYATEPTKLKRLSPADTAWADITALTSGRTHQMCVYEGRLYFVDDNQILSINDAEVLSTTAYTLDLSVLAANGHISWIQAGSNRIWIGITKKDGTKGVIYEWDGVTENTPSKPYYIEAQGSAGCAIWNDIPYVMDIEGRLLAFTGSNFEEVARLPIMQYDVVNSDYATSSPLKICHFNGIKYINDSIQILINNKVSGTGEIGTEENYPSGVYEYTKENGLTHRYSPSITVIDESTVDYGQHVVNEVGAIFDATARRSNATTNYSTIMFGVNLEGADGTNLDSINIDIVEERTNDPEHKRLGYLITPFIESQRVTDVWKKIIVKYKKLIDTTDQILVKYRTTKDEPVIIQNIVWDNDTSFTDNDAVIANLNVGDEIEVLNGNGGGAVAHIQSIVDNGSDYTITLDSAIIGVSTSDISDVRFQTWKQLPAINKDEFQFKELSVPQYNKDTEIQFKIVMNWTNIKNELREIIVVNDTEQYAK